MPLVVEFRVGLELTGLAVAQLHRPPFPLLPVELMPAPPNDDEEELIDLDAANVPSGLGSPSERALRAFLDPANVEPPATNMWHDEVAAFGLCEVTTRTYVQREPGWVSFEVTTECVAGGSDFIFGATLRGWERWPLADEVD